MDKRKHKFMPPKFKTSKRAAWFFLGGFYATSGLGLSRLFHDAQKSTQFGRLLSRASTGFKSPSFLPRLTDVRRLWAASLSDCIWQAVKEQISPLLLCGGANG